MEAYITAEIEVIRIEEDVITASVEKCEAYYYVPLDGDTPTNATPAGWTVYYDNGDIVNYTGPDKPEMCP